MTPLVEVSGVWAKLECCNPTGSIKDRIARYIIEESERLGLLKPGMRIVEATSGNTGIALSAVAREKGYPITIVMPENMTEERKTLLRGLGCELILCSERGSFAEAASIRDELAKESGYFNPDQFSNPLNVNCHYHHTAEELLLQLKQQGIRDLGAFVAGVGTGGTLVGVGKRLKESFPNMKIVAVEPKESAVMTGGSAGSHFINGIGDGFIPAIAGNSKGGLHPLIDEVAVVSSQDALEAAKTLAHEHALCVGVSAGANYLAALSLQSDCGPVGTVFADSYTKYRSLGLAPVAGFSCRYRESGGECPGAC
jgi:cysteine synthase A